MTRLAQSGASHGLESSARRLIHPLVTAVLRYFIVIYFVFMFTPQDPLHGDGIQEVCSKVQTRRNDFFHFVSAANHAEKHDNYEKHAKPAPLVMACPDGFDWDPVKEMCGRILRKIPVIRCPQGRLNKDSCLDFYEPKDIACPPGYVDQGSRCAHSETAQKQLVCPPDQRPTGHLCSKIIVKEVGYVCEKGSLDDEGRCAQKAIAQPRRICPPGFIDDSIQSCTKISYFPCNEHHDHAVPSYAHMEQESPESDCAKGKKCHDNRRQLGKKKDETYVPPHPVIEPQIVKTCWDKQTVPISIECPYDSVPVGKVCIVLRYFPKIAKCAGWLENGRCLIEILSDSRWACPLGYMHGLNPGGDEEGLHAEFPSVALQKSPIDPNYAPRRLGVTHTTEVMPRLPSVVTLPADENYVVEYEPGLSRRDDEKLSLKTKLKKTKHKLEEEFLQVKIPKHLKRPGYCYRETFSGYKMTCHNGYEPNTETRMCMGKFDPIYVCDKGYINEHDGCVKYEYVQPTKIEPSSVISCAGIECAQYPVLGYGWQKEGDVPHKK